VRPLGRLSALVSLFLGISLAACSRGGSYAVAPFENVPTLRSGPLSDVSGKLYGDMDKVICNLALTNGPVELPGRMCVDAGGTIEGEAFQSQQSKTPYQPSGRAVEVPLNRRSGGVHYVPVKVNDALTLDFLVDSGATTVSMPVDVVSALVRLGTLAPGDVLGSKDYRLADGSILSSQTFQIRSLRVGDTVLRNVTGSTAPVHGGLLLGQSFLSRFRSWSIDNGRQVLVLNDKL
jgi:clan AA aspartic protease (TIGR02281 family)